MKREEKKRRTRNQLVEAAMACFSEYGYEGTTVEAITQRAGVAKGTFFNYFETKGDVLRYVGAVQEEWMLEEIRRIEANPGDSIIDALMELMVKTATRLPLSRPLVRAMFQATLQTPEETATQVGYFHRVGLALIPLCEQGQARGELTRRMPARHIAGLIMQTYSGILLMWALVPQPDEIEPLVRHTYDALFNGLRNPSSHRTNADHE